MNPDQAKPDLSIIVVIFNMEREVKRTLHSLSAEYQEDVCESDYEVCVIDNGSKVPLTNDYVKSVGPNFRYFYLEEASPSPAFALNFGVNQAIGEIVGLMIDGARILSPGIIKYALRAFKAFKNPIVTTHGWHLGPDLQSRSILSGYNREIEDQLLADIDWPNDGYRLFEISTLAGSSKNGWFMPIAESNCMFMQSVVFEKMNGYDERFDMPGGGIVNLDLYNRACELPGSELIVILGEGNFHQLHGGVATNIPFNEFPGQWQKWSRQYQKIHSKNYTFPTKPSKYIGQIKPPALKWLLHSAKKSCEQFETGTRIR